jgi:hypothetical protein
VFVVHVMVAPDEVTEFAETPEITSPLLTVLLTVTVTLLLAMRFPESVAIAVTVWLPLATVVVFHEVE